MAFKNTIKTILIRSLTWWQFYTTNIDTLRPAVASNICRMLSCGNRVRGYLEYSCSNDTCNHFKIVPMTCKSRLCSSCGKKLTAQWIENQRQILPKTRWQHITFTQPDEYWPLYWEDRSLLNDLMRIGAECIKEYAAKHGINPGLFQVVHTFGRDGKKNVHLHLSVTCGGLTANNTQWKNLKFSHFPLMKAWRKAVTNLLWQAYKTGRLALPDDKPTLTAIRAWLKDHYQKIWHVHLAKPTNSHKKNINYLGRYLKRPVIAQSRIIYENASEVVFKYLDHNDKKTKRKYLTPLEFVERLTWHIHDKYFRAVRYYGFLANCVRGKLLPIVFELIGLDQTELQAATDWASLIQLNFNFNPLTCILCGSQLLLTNLNYGKSDADIFSLHHRQLAHGKTC